MCKFCGGVRQDLAENDAGDYQDGVVLEISCEDGPFEILATGYFDGGYICGTKSVEIIFCPMCGRSLGGELHEVHGER